MVPATEVPDVMLKVMAPANSVWPVLTTAVTGMLPTENVAWAKAAAVRPKNITAAIRRVFVFILLSTPYSREWGTAPQEMN
jgi:hypothetical protein